MAFKKQNQPFDASMLPLKTRLWLKFKDFIKYPFTIAGMYRGHSYGVGEIINILDVKNNSDLYILFNNYRRWNAKTLYTYIYLPLFGGLISFGVLAFVKKEEYINYYNKIKAPITSNSFSGKVSKIKDRVVFIVQKQPLGKFELYCLLGGYLFSIAGARFASFNPVFDKTREIQRNLQAHGKLNIDGKPWKIIYTREAVLVYTWGIDPMKVTADQSFWSDIGFLPTEPKYDKKNNRYTVMVILRKQELNPKMIFEIDKAIAKRVRKEERS